MSGYYQTFLHRQADTGGLNFFVGLLLGHPPTQPIFTGDNSGQVLPVRDEDVIAAIVGSTEYLR